MSRSLYLAAALPVFWCVSAIAQPWTPNRQVEVLIGTAAGGALDRTGRVLQQAIQNRKLAPVPLNIVNKVGGGGAVSWAYMNQKPGDGHYLSITSTPLITNKLTGANPISYTDVTPIVHLLAEYHAIAVAADSNIRTGKDFIEKLRADPASIRFGLGTPLGASSHIAISSVVKAAGIDPKKLRFAIFKSGAESTTALLGGHVDVVATSAGNFARQVEAGKIRLIGIASPKRLTGILASVPTWNEQGINSVFSNWRGVAGPKGLSPAQIAFWENVFAKAVESDEWKADVESVMGVSEFLRHRETMAFLDQDYKQTAAILTELGLVKQP